MLLYIPASSFAKRCPIFEILLPLESVVNLHE